MDIKVIYVDWFFNGCHTETQEQIIEAKIKKLKEIAKTNDNLLYDDKFEMFYIIGDMKEFDLEEGREESICTWLSSCNESDEVEIAGIKYYKEDCIDMLGEKLDNDEELQGYIKLIFKQSSLDENFDLGEVLINKMIKYVMLDKINTLQQCLVKEKLEINWK
jgi:hypothetical protein